jgi:hypothetical protein
LTITDGWLGVRVNVDRFGRALKPVARLAAVAGSARRLLLLG